MLSVSFNLLLHFTTRFSKKSSKNFSEFEKILPVRASATVFLKYKMWGFRMDKPVPL